MGTRKFTASVVLDMLTDGEDDSLNNANQQELEEESEDEAVVNGDYLGEDGEEIVIPSDLLHPGVRLALGRLTKDELPCKIDSLLLCDVEVNDEERSEHHSIALQFCLKIVAVSLDELCVCHSSQQFQYL